MKSKRVVVIITSLFLLFLFSFSMQTIVVSLLNNPLFVSDISFLFHKAYAQKSVFITPGASNSSNNNDAFVPPVDVVSSGSIVSWTNEDSTIHTITADDRSFDSGPISPGGTFDNAFDSTGIFGYHCSIHSFMRGSIIVH